MATRLLAFELHGTAEAGQPTLDRAALLYFHEAATAGADVWDATKLTPPAAAYALLAFEGVRGGETVKRAQESRPFEIVEPFEVPLHVVTQGTAGPLTLTWPTAVGLPDTWGFVLRDLVTGAEVDLREATEYTFEVAGGRAAAPSSLEALQADGSASSLEASAARFTLIVGPGVTTGSEGEGVMPVSFALAGVFPNPAAGQATIAFDVPQAADVTVEVYDALGRRVAVVADGPHAAGRHTVRWTGQGLPSGAYLVRMRAVSAGAATFEQTRSVTVVR